MKNAFLLEMKTRGYLNQCTDLDRLDEISNKKSISLLLNPERKVSERALEVHGYTDKFLSSQKKFSDVVDEFLKFIENKKLVMPLEAKIFGFTNYLYYLINKSQNFLHQNLSKLKSFRNMVLDRSNQLCSDSFR